MTVFRLVRINGAKEDINFTEAEIILLEDVPEFTTIDKVLDHINQYLLVINPLCTYLAVELTVKGRIISCWNIISATEQFVNNDQVAFLIFNPAGVFALKRNNTYITDTPRFIETSTVKEAIELEKKTKLGLRRSYNSLNEMVSTIKKEILVNSQDGEGSVDKKLTKLLTDLQVFTQSLDEYNRNSEEWMSGERKRNKEKDFLNSARPLNLPRKSGFFISISEVTAKEYQRVFATEVEETENFANNSEEIELHDWQMNTSKTEEIELQNWQMNISKTEEDVTAKEYQRVFTTEVEETENSANNGEEIELPEWQPPPRM